MPVLVVIGTYRVHYTASDVGNCGQHSVVIYVRKTVRFSLFNYQWNTQIKSKKPKKNKQNKRNN